MKTPCLLVLLVGSCLTIAAQTPAPVNSTTQTTNFSTPAETVVAVAPSPKSSAAPPPAAGAKRSAAALEQLVAPIALYPDPLLATILPAAVYPLEIVQAARFVADTNNLATLDAQPWDDSVKAVARIPAAIQKLNADISWTMELGEAFLAQDKDVMDAIQTMRAKAQKAGTLQTTPEQIVTVTNMIVEKTIEQQVVVVTNTIVQIEPSSSSVIYVPTYNPYTVYYPPYGYVYNPVAPLVTFGIAVGIGAIIHNNCDWHHGGCYNNVNINVNNNFNQNNNINRNSPGGSQKWQPDQNRLNKSGSASAATRNAEARGFGSGNAGPSTGNLGARPSTGTATARPTTATSARPAAPSSGAAQSSVRPPSVRQPSVQQPSVNRSGAASAASARPPVAPSGNRPAASGSAFGGTSSGAGARDFSNRGSSSRSSGGGGGRSGGGRR